MSAVPMHGLPVLRNQRLRNRVVDSPIAGSPELIAALARFAGDVETDAMWFADDVGRARNELENLSSRGAAAIRDRVAERIIPGATDLQHSAFRMKRALHNHAADMTRIHGAARRCVEEVERLLHTVRASMDQITELAHQIGVEHTYEWVEAPATLMPEPRLSERASLMDPMSREQLSLHLRSVHEAQWAAAATSWRQALDAIVVQQEAWERLYNERQESELQLKSAVTNTTVGQLVSVGGSSAVAQRDAVANGISGELWGQPFAERSRVRTAHPRLRDLIGSGEGRGIWDTPPRPEAIAASWAALSEGDRDELIRSVPWVIGNLPGLPISVRDRANRALIAHYRDAPGKLAPDQLQLLAELSELIDREIEQTKIFGEPRPPIQIGALDLEAGVPKTMVVYGNAHTATHTTVAVPGMNSDAPGALESWDEASRNLHHAQEAVLGESDTHTVIAWLGYDTPDIPISGDWGVLGAQAAEAGAARLALELDGLHVASHGSTSVNVVGHSYGTTTATIALTQTQYEVDTLVLLGSAGLDSGHVSTLDALHVAEIRDGQRAIFATHATADRLAPIGAGASGRGLLNAEAKDPFGIYKFSSVYEGALTFPSEGDPSLDLKKTDGHSTIGERLEPGLLGARASRGHGYLDLKTQSIDSVAQILSDRISPILEESLQRSQPEASVVYAGPGGTVWPTREPQETG